MCGGLFQAALELVQFADVLEYLARGGETTVPENELWTPARLVIVRFPSRKNAEDFLACKEYAPVKAIRHKHAETTLTIVDGI